jgi:hypothetical protein
MPVSQAEQQAVVERFLFALRTGHVQELMEVMAPDVVLIADGGRGRAGRARSDPRRRASRPAPGPRQPGADAGHERAVAERLAGGPR